MLRRLTPQTQKSRVETTIMMLTEMRKGRMMKLKHPLKVLRRMLMEQMKVRRVMSKMRVMTAKMSTLLMIRILRICQMHMKILMVSLTHLGEKIQQITLSMTTPLIWTVTAMIATELRAQKKMTPIILMM